MDDMEKKEELEQETVTEEIKEPVEESSTEVVEETSETEEMTEEESVEESIEEVPEEESVEEPTEEVLEEEPAKEAEPVAAEAEKGGNNMIGLIIGFVLLIAFLAVCWMNPNVGSGAKDTGVFYAKDNDLYFYDMKNEPYLVQEGISAGGEYNYFYTAWGAGVASASDLAYYITDIDRTGCANLYCRDAKNAEAEAVLIDTAVFDYKISEDGKAVAYLAVKENTLQLCYFNGAKSQVVAKNMSMEEDGYALSADGRYLVYRDMENMLCAWEVQDDGGVNMRVLAVNPPLYEVAEDTLYYVAKEDGIFNIYSYDFVNEPELVAENAQYMSLMPNGKDLLYGVKPTEVIPYSELLEDDMAEIDAKMTEDDPDYDQKLMRDELRAAMASGEGLEPLMQEYYLISNGKATLVAENVVSAIAVTESEQSFIAGYQAKPFQPLYLSVIGGGLDMVDMIYYMSLNYGGMQAFLADGNGNVEVLTGSVLLDTLQVSSDGSRAAYMMEDPNTGGNILMQMEVGKAADAAAVQMDVEKFAFLGGNGPLVYYYDYANGAGVLASAESERTIAGVAGVEFVKDVKEVYYIRDISMTTGAGQMQHWNGKDEPAIVDGGVFAFQYKGNGKVAVLYNYDLVERVGDLGYYDGKGVTMLDKGITGIFIN